MKKLYVTSDVDKFSKIHSLLGYKEVKRKKSVFKNTSFVTYEKVKEVPNYKVLKDKYAPYSTVPFFFVILLAALAVSCATTFLILNIVFKDLDKLLYFYLLMLPTFLFTISATGLSFYRYFIELKNIQRVAAIPLLEKEVKL